MVKECNNSILQPFPEITCVSSRMKKSQTSHLFSNCLFRGAALIANFQRMKMTDARLLYTIETSKLNFVFNRCCV